MSFDYFVRYQTNKITSAPSYLFPPSTGTDGAYPSMNFSKLKAWGWDFTITHKNTIGKFKYNMSLNLSKSDDKYLDYGDESRRRLTTGNLTKTDAATLRWHLATSSISTRTTTANSTRKTTST